MSAAREKTDEVPLSPPLFASASPFSQRLPRFDLTGAFDLTRAVLRERFSKRGGQSVDKSTAELIYQIALLVTEEPKQFIFLQSTKSLLAMMRFRTTIRKI